MGRTSRKTLSLCKDGWAADLVILSADKSICRRPGDLRCQNERPADLSPDCSAFQRDCCADKLGGGIYRGLSFVLPGDGGSSMSVERGVSLTIYISTYSFSPSE